MADLAAMMGAVLSECPDLEKVGAVETVDVAMRDAMTNLQQLESTIVEGGGIGKEIAASFMTIAAMAAILNTFPETDDRTRLARAGKVVGEAIAKRWRARIKTSVAHKLRSN
jgi:hypothetical protein